MLLLALLLGLVPGTPQDSPLYDDKQLMPLAKSLADYFEARDEGDAPAEARAAVAAELAALVEDTEDGDGLLYAGALGRAYWLSLEDARTKVKPGKVTDTRSDRGTLAGERLHYAVRVPRDYDPDQRAYPLILALPEAGEKPAEHLRRRWASAPVRAGAVVVVPRMPENVDEWDRVMVNGRPGGLTHVLTALTLAGERYAVDFDAVYVVGSGDSVPAALAAGNYGPHLFGGVVARAGDAADLGPANFSNLPTLFLGGGAKARAFKNAGDELGYANCEIVPKDDEVEAWRWMLAHPRETYPEEVALVVGTPFPTRAYWLRVSPIAPDARARAVVDRDRGKITLETEGVSHATLYLNDELLDLTRPVTIKRNGFEETLTIPRGLPLALDLLHDGTSDPAAVYVAEKVVDMRAEEPDPIREGEGGADAEYTERLAAAAEDPAGLFETYLWCEDTERSHLAANVLRRLLRIDPDHAKARAALSHRRAAGQWFTTEFAHGRFLRSQDPAVAAARGYVEHDGLWMHPEDAKLANKGLVKDHERGVWLNAAERRKLERGWARQDLAWIRPADAEHVDDGLLFVDGEWLLPLEAERRQARIDGMWTLPDAEVHLHTTLPRDVARRALVPMSAAVDDLRRVFGCEPPLPLEVTLLRDEEQYDRFAFGDPEGRRRASHAGRLHVIHSAFFAESAFVRAGRRWSYRGMGVGYWNHLVPYGDLYGVHTARLAVGLSFVEALDPSPKAVRKATSKGPSPEYYAEFLAEKQLPAWLRQGAAVYAERYFLDRTVGEDGDPLWARNWSLDNLANRGGLRSLDEVFAFELDPDDREDGQRCLLEVGAVVSFLVDGGYEPLDAAHGEWKRVFNAGRLGSRDVEALEAVLRAHEPQLRSFVAR